MRSTEETIGVGDYPGAALEPQHDGEARVYGEHVADSITAQYKTKPAYEGHGE